MRGHGSDSGEIQFTFIVSRIPRLQSQTTAIHALAAELYTLIYSVSKYELKANHVPGPLLCAG